MNRGPSPPPNPMRYNFWLLRRLPLRVFPLKTTQLKSNTNSLRKLFTVTKFRNSSRPTLPPHLLPLHIPNQVFFVVGELVVCRCCTTIHEVILCIIISCVHLTICLQVYYISFSKKFLFLHLKTFTALK